MAHTMRHATSKSKNTPYIPIQVLLLAEKKNHTLARSFLNLSKKKQKNGGKKSLPDKSTMTICIVSSLGKETTRIGNLSIVNQGHQALEFDKHILRTA